MEYTKISSVIGSLLLLFSLILYPSLSHCTAYYVNGNTGNDTEDGTQANPWETIGHAVDEASGNDTIYIYPGYYIESIDLKPIPKRELLLIGLGEDDSLPVIQSTAPDIHTIDLYEFSGTLQGLAVTGADAHGINIYETSSTARIINCQIYGNSYGIHITGPSSPLILNNRIFANRTCGIGNMDNSSAIIDGNQIYENGILSDALAGICVSVDSSPVIQNNIIRDNHPSGINVRDTANPIIVNNTLLNHNEQDATGTAVKVNQAKDIQSPVILNNIIAYNDTGLFSQEEISYSENDYNNLYQNSIANMSGFTGGEHDISADPLFHDVFFLQHTSPCIDAGTSTDSPDHDMNGVIRPRGSGIDMGACEYQNSFVPSILFLLR